MTLPLEEYRAQVHSAATNMFDLLTEEYGIPPVYISLHLGGFLFSQLLANYEKEGREPPEEFKKFMEVDYPKLIEDNYALIVQQYLTLNSEGTA